MLVDRAGNRMLFLCRVHLNTQEWCLRRPKFHFQIRPIYFIVLRLCHVFLDDVLAIWCDCGGGIGALATLNKLSRFTLSSFSILSLWFTGRSLTGWWYALGRLTSLWRHTYGWVSEKLPFIILTSKTYPEKTYEMVSSWVNFTEKIAFYRVKFASNPGQSWFYVHKLGFSDYVYRSTLIMLTYFDLGVKSRFSFNFQTIYRVF